MSRRVVSRTSAVNSDGATKNVGNIVKSREEWLASGVRETTSKVYTKAVMDFRMWLKIQLHLKSEKTVSDLSVLSAFELDHMLSLYFTDLRNMGMNNLQKANNCFHGIRHFYLQFRMTLPISHRFLKVWTKHKPNSQKSPIPWRVAVVLARMAAEADCAAEGLAMLLMHHTYIRVGNLLQLRRKDVNIRYMDDIDVSKSRSHPYAVISLRRTKTGKDQCVFVERYDLARVLQRYILDWEDLKPDDRIFPWSYAYFKQFFTKLCESATLSRFNFTLHKFRHGGATESALSGKSFEYIKHRGLWKSDEAVRNYISTGLCCQIMDELPELILQLGNLLQRNVCLCFRTDIPLFK